MMFYERGFAVKGPKSRPLAQGDGRKQAPQISARLRTGPDDPMQLGHYNRDPVRDLSLLERFPITWNRVIEKESLNFKELEHVLVEKVAQLFRDML